MNPLIAAALAGALLYGAPPPGPSQPADQSSAPDVVPEEGRPRGVWPLQPQPEVVAGFDPPSTTWSAGHRGVDLLGAPGAPVRAALGGTVTFAGTIAGRGVVVVDHGSFRTTYEPVSSSVQVGSRVRSGTVIGELQTGLSHCAPRTCLHWGLIEGETYRDPLSLIGRARIRLLPVDHARG